MENNILYNFHFPLIELIAMNASKIKLRKLFIYIIIVLNNLLILLVIKGGREILQTVY